MFYKLIFTSALFCISCIASSDIKNLDSFKASFSQTIISSSKKVNDNSYVTKIEDVDYLIKTSKTDDKINYIKYKDKLENDVEIKFSSVVQNGDIQDEMFKFTPPSNYDIIRK